MPSSRRVAALASCKLCSLGPTSASARGIRSRTISAAEVKTSGDGDGLLPSGFLPLEVEHRAQTATMTRATVVPPRSAKRRLVAILRPSINSAAINDVAGLQLGRLRLLVGPSVSHCSADFKSAPRSTSLVVS